MSFIILNPEKNKMELEGAQAKIGSNEHVLLLRTNH
jgi:hypothetical protein